MSHPLIVPGDDGAGMIDMVGSGVNPARLGQRVWLHSAAQLSPGGTAAELTFVPAEGDQIGKVIVRLDDFA
jgi:NADPH2:quinone reductase